MGMGCKVLTSFHSNNSSQIAPEIASENSKMNVKALALVAEDLEALEFFSAPDLSLSSVQSRRRFIQVFGGYSGNNIRNFINERIKYFISVDDLLPIDSVSSENSAQKLGWTRVENYEKMKGSIAASNYGSQLWLQSLIDERPAAIVLKTWEIIPVSSTRVGIMLIGPAYNGSIRKLDGSSVPFPQEFRQSLLIHEARHSDCVGGVTEDDLRIAREASTYLEFTERFDSKKCGHLHALCREGDYRGLPACDSMRWGSYGIQALYLEAALKAAPFGSEKYQLLLATFIDTKSRLFFNYDLDMIHGLEDPELDSLGLR